MSVPEPMRVDEIMVVALLPCPRSLGPGQRATREGETA